MLDEARIAALRTQDAEHLDQVFTPESPLREEVVQSIARMEKGRVEFKTRFDTQRLEVTRATPDEIEIRQVVQIEPRFIHVSGRNLAGHQQIIQTIDWRLTLLSEGWRLADAEVVRQRTVGTDHG